MKRIYGETLILLVILVTSETHDQTSNSLQKLAKTLASHSCIKSNNGQPTCFCGKQKLTYDPATLTCINDKIVPRKTYSRLKTKVLRLTNQTIDQSARNDNDLARCVVLEIKRENDREIKSFVPLRNVSVEAWIDSFAADVTLTQVFVNEENDTIEAVYVFPIEENAAVYSFTAVVDNRTITAVLKERKVAEKEYETAVSQGQTAVLIRQSQQTLDTFKVNVGSLPPGKECVITIKYVGELDLVDSNSIRFVVPTTIAPRYNPSMGGIQSPDNTGAKYVQKSPYSIWYRVHVERGENYKIMQVANLSHPVNVTVSSKTIDVSLGPVALDRDIILDIDLPERRPSTVVSVEQFADSTSYAVLLSFVPRLSDFMKIQDDHNESNTEFIFIVDCSGSMSADNRIALAREAMLLFIRSLPMGAHFNIIRFGSNFDILFKNEIITSIYDETTARQAENVTRSMAADFGGTELLEPLEYLKNHPPVRGRSRQIFLLTDGEISNTNEVIDLCRTMASTTRIFSFGIGDSPSRALVKGLARATNGQFVFIPPNSKVDTYVANQLGRALQPGLVNTRLEWHGLSKNVSQAPKTISPLYINDRVLVYAIVDKDEILENNITIDIFVGDHRFGTVKLPTRISQKQQTIRRLAAKALIQELQHMKSNSTIQNMTNIEQDITKLSLKHEILSPYTAFVGVETDGPIKNNTNSNIRYVPIQISKDAEQSSHYHRTAFNYMSPIPMMSISRGSPYSHNSLPGASAQSMSYSRHRMGLYQPVPIASYASSVHDAGQAPMFKLSSNPPATTSTKVNRQLIDRVRWLIDRQSFNGAWILSLDDVLTLTDGKTIESIQSTITQSKDILTTALAIAVLESKHADEKKLWFAVVEKGRKQLLRFGLTTNQINILINELKTQL